MKRIKDIEKCYELLVEAREIFSDLKKFCYGDSSVVEISKMERWCKKLDTYIETS
jgi:hypothetical protein